MALYFVHIVIYSTIDHQLCETITSTNPQLLQVNVVVKEDKNQSVDEITSTPITDVIVSRRSMEVDLNYDQNEDVQSKPIGELDGL